MMSLQTLLLVLGSVVFSVAGQLLLKSGTQHVVARDHVYFVVAALQNGRILAGLAAWIASTLCWLFVLRVAPLSRAYGLTSLTYVFILISSVVIYGEQVRRVHVLGTLLIVAGIGCLITGK